MASKSKADLNTLTLAEVIAGLKAGDFKSVDVTAACLDQISSCDPEIKAFVTITAEQALSEAKLADDLIAKHGPAIFEKKPLLGVPYACKDNYNTKDVPTTAASNILVGYMPPYESTVTKKLHDAGAVLLGKTNMDAFAHGSSTETSDFFKTKNPWDLTRVPGGSSGGSAAAVSADMCIFAMGSETAGSIRGPAAWCGISGLKPTYGRVSRYGVIAMASSTDSPGPLTKNIADAAYVLTILAGKDPLDATSSPREVPNYTDFKKVLKGLKIGKPASYFMEDLEPAVKQAVEAAAVTLKDLGAEIIEIDLLSPKYSIAVYTILQRSEVSSNLARFDGIRYGHPRFAFGEEARKRMMLGAYTLSSGYYDAYYSKAQKVRTLIVDDFAKAFKLVDIIIGPTMPCTALKLGESDNSPMFGELMDVLTEPGAIAGIPAISIPVGVSKDNNMPVGMQILGPQFSEKLIIDVANEFQTSTKFHEARPKVK